MTAIGDLDPARIGGLHATELARFRQARPRSLTMIARAQAHMPNGAPMAWMAQDNDQPVYIQSGSGPGFTDLDGLGSAMSTSTPRTWRCSVGTRTR